eukprot:CAMPEP_0185018210 /NCGR_PEP_ID=MMETSP1103-20130426/1008_1 /TAXON_ID=36769 /ORGANISM="Paraphysomonas bandaiensis, Strain Caron Lab Isolate" /LENGTH=84 /DNA_ID=CAMNT_0027547941 /DNA_START=757 /DNA_END=1008 /DNA_ORIENTATION=-
MTVQLLEETEKKPVEPGRGYLTGYNPPEKDRHHETFQRMQPALQMEEENPTRPSSEKINTGASTTDLPLARDDNSHLRSKTTVW